MEKTRGIIDTCARPDPICAEPCRHITGFILVKTPTKYMIKKYGWAKAFDVNLIKAIRKNAKR